MGPSRFPTLLLALVVALTILTTTISAQQTCSAKSKCGEAAPCCSTYGYCGSSTDHCLGSCDPTSSFSPNSCKPMPKCKPQTIRFDNNAKPWVAAESYRGDPNQAPFTLDQGVAEAGKTGTKMILTKSGDAKRGSLLSTTRYWYYGQASAVMKHGSWNGVVNTFIGMSSTKDEIDWEWTTSDDQDMQTNWYWRGDPDGYTHGFSVPNTTLNTIAPPRFSTRDWHTYTLDWSPTRLRWLIDGTPVRTLTRKSTLKNNIYHYPSSPMRLQMSIWGAGDGTFQEGTVDWSGGLIDWKQATNGRFVNMVKSVTISCADPEDVNDGKPNYVFSAKQRNAQNGQPRVLSTSRSSIMS
ncbi:Glycoside hydrolase, family 16 [Kalmanozyma brasiliensis GHG001]|uniref:GH16 domain-containing protein n=1 Tax=Kalmanozyma brasiliensis (strain GHG001) TaxID=1365824 RepID=V5EWI8_KALBG|nr:Glycoside hydrolase, family 16 [Kalmanozyma brasiliensis GHG001]EST09945.1 Glycoside hydrolase, family 16 [Kalmanozyma brasiliensis GHG001]